MNPNYVDLIIQTIATVIGGLILFLFGLVFSGFSKRTKEYIGWISKAWRLIIALLLIICIAFNIFSTTNSIYISVLPILFAIAVYLLVIYFNNSVEDKAAKVFMLQNNKIDILRADTIYAEIHYWELRDIPENILSTCYEALSIAPPTYHNYPEILNIIEYTIGDLQKKKSTISTFRRNELHQVLTHVPETYAAQAKHILKMID